MAVADITGGAVRRRSGGWRWQLGFLKFFARAQWMRE
jgi:hypothetical protein